jgi:NADPH:quinone reductase-like Zn-dependent oxidoreductase
MKALRIHQRDDPAIRYEEAPVPSPGIGDVLVEVRAASFTPTELEWPSTWVDRAGRDRMPVVPAHEVSGIVTALGYGTTGLAVGDEVYGVTDWYRDGAAADYVAVEARNLAPKPDSVSHVEAASLPLAGLTAWQALFVHGDMRPAQTVVVNGASGGVGTLAVQLARTAGARVVAVAHGWARDLLLDLGADEFVDVEFAGTNGTVRDADLLIDLVGGEVATRCSSMVRRGGAAVSAVAVDPDVGLGVRSAFFVVEPDRGQLLELARLVDGGGVRPVVGRVVDLREGAGGGFAAKREGGVPGKVVMRPGG